jgi:aconitate hydratase
MGIAYPEYKEPDKILIDANIFCAPPEDGSSVEVIRGPNIQPLPKIASLQNSLEGPVLLKLENNVSTDDISPAGSKVVPFRSNIPEISKFTFARVDPTFYERAMQYQSTGSFLVAGANYGQGSSREHAALAPNFLGIKSVLAKSYARIHRSNLINFGIIPLVFEKEEDWKKIDRDDVLKIENIVESIRKETSISVQNKTKNISISMKCTLTAHEKTILLEGGLINYMIKNS